MRKRREKSDLQVLNEARYMAGLPPRLDMPEREHKVSPSVKPPCFSRKSAEKGGILKSRWRGVYRGSG